LFTTITSSTIACTSSLVIGASSPASVAAANTAAFTASRLSSVTPVISTVV